MSKNRSENVKLEIGKCISEIEFHLKEDLSDKERWMVKYAFLSGESFGLGEATVIVNDKE